MAEKTYTRSTLMKMKRDELMAHALSEFDVDLDEEWTKGEMVGYVISLQDGRDNVRKDDEAAAKGTLEPDKEVVKEIRLQKRVVITVHKSPDPGGNLPVKGSINGFAYVIHREKRVAVPYAVYQALSEGCVETHYTQRVERDGEIVTEADINSAEEAYAYLSKLRQLVRYLGVSTGDMEKGAMRCEPNFSLKNVETGEWGTKVEIKNLNSFRAVRNAIAYEIDRQIKVLNEGGVIEQVTRGWDENRGITFLQRSKEGDTGYRPGPHDRQRLRPRVRRQCEHCERGVRRGDEHEDHRVVEAHHPLLGGRRRPPNAVVRRADTEHGDDRGHVDQRGPPGAGGIGSGPRHLDQRRTRHHGDPRRDEVDQLSYRDLMRLGAEKGLIQDPRRWFDYRQQRNITSHTYDEDRANSVFNSAVSFLDDARLLLERLKATDDDD